MHLHHTINIGVRLQAAIVLAIVALWFWSLIRVVLDSGEARVGLAWILMFYSLPFAAAGLLFILPRSIRRDDRLHRWWVRLAVFATFVLWVVFGLLFLEHL